MNKNVYSCIISCPLREDCRKYFDLYCKIERGIVENLIRGQIHDSEAIERACKKAKKIAKFPPEFSDVCLLEISLPKPL